MTTSKLNDEPEQTPVPVPVPVDPGTTPKSEPIVQPDNWQPFTPPKD
jgi:hypothetical protein